MSFLSPCCRYAIHSVCQRYRSRNFVMRSNVRAWSCVPESVWHRPRVKKSRIFITFCSVLVYYTFFVCFTSFYDMLRYLMLCHVVLRYVTSYHATLSGGVRPTIAVHSGSTVASGSFPYDRRSVNISAWVSIERLFRNSWNSCCLIWV